jgi:hypothetical protein
MWPEILSGSRLSSLTVSTFPESELRIESNFIRPRGTIFSPHPINTHPAIHHVFVRIRGKKLKTRLTEATAGAPDAVQPATHDGNPDFDFDIGTWHTHSSRFMHPLSEPRSGATDARMP